MSNKFNTSALSEYCKNYARKVAADAYQQGPTLSGQQIMSLTAIPQINLLIISSLADKWRADAEKFRSPYFDFSAPDVREGMQNFMNVVSQHIAVRREHLEPLLADATCRTIELVFDPRSYFDELFRDQPDFTLTADVLKQVTRYTKINTFIPVYIAQRMNGKPFVYVNQAISYLDEVLSQRGHELEHYDSFVAKLAEKHPMNVSTLLRSHVPDAIPAPPARSFFDAAAEPANPPAPLVPAADMPTDTPPDHRTAPVSPQPDPTPAPETADEGGAAGPIFSHEPAGPTPVAPTAYPSQMQTGGLSRPSDTDAEPLVSDEDAAPSLNDTLRETAVDELPTLAQTFRQTPLESVARSISLNQKFRFINQLFNGNTNAYNQAIDEIDSLDNYGQALDLISYRYASQYMWDMSSDEVSELVEILKRRFA